MNLKKQLRQIHIIKTNKAADSWTILSFFAIFDPKNGVMSNPYFKFKQFTVFHDKCAMKVGTDGALLGAWTDVSRSGRVLDVGTGSGLIALMLAQRSEADIVAIDVDADAVEQARENVERSPWKGRISVELLDARRMPEEWNGCFDTVVSNPPYFVEDVKSPSGSRNRARHADGLDFGSLLDGVRKVLSDEGAFSVVLPAETAPDFTALAMRRGLCLKRQTWVRTKPEGSPKRVLLELSVRPVLRTEVDSLVIESRPREYSPEFRELLRPYYLAL